MGGYAAGLAIGGEVSDFRTEENISGVGSSVTENGLLQDGIKRKHLFILNPRSFRYTNGGIERMSVEIRNCFNRAGLPEDDYHIHVSRYPRDAIGVIQKYINNIPPEEIVRVYAVGGDGILFDCLNGIVETPNTELAAIPWGNSNDFVRAFGDDKVPLFRSLAGQLGAGTVKTDIIYGGSNYAINFCTVGLDSVSIMHAVRLMKTFDPLIRRFRGLIPLMFVLGGLMGIRDEKVRTQKYTVTIDGEDFSGRYNNINIANGPCYGGDKSAVTAAMPDDGFLDALFIRSESFWQSLGGITDYLKGLYYKHPAQFAYKRARKIAISSETPILVNLDGEVFFDTHITVEVVPQGINFVAAGGQNYERRAELHE
jgi:diacylglycerol kinase family enzyme